jgi:hypothetical protein
MDLDAFDGQVLSLGISGFFRKIAKFFGAFYQDLMAFQEVGDEVFRRVGLHRKFGDGGQRCEGFQTAGGNDVERADSLGEFVDGEEELLILGLEKGVQAEEGGALHVPMGELGLPEQGVGVRQQAGEGVRDGIGRFGGFHDGLADLGRTFSFVPLADRCKRINPRHAAVYGPISREALPAPIKLLGTSSRGGMFTAEKVLTRTPIPNPQSSVKIAAVLLVFLTAAQLVPAAAELRQPFAIASLVVAIALLVMLFTGKTPQEAPQPAVAEAVKPIPTTIPQNQAQAEVVMLLGILQDKGRFIDFLMEDITPYSDADVGGVARAVHQGCKEALNEHFHIEPISTEGEGATITVPAGYSADDFRLVGNLSGEAPFTGKVVHKGWKTTSVKLPRVLKTDRLPAIAPAQVEVK